MYLKRIAEAVERHLLLFLAVISIGLAAIIGLRDFIPDDFAAISHVLLVAENGARDPSVSVIDLPSIATSTVVLERVRNSLKLTESLIDLKKRVSAKVLSRSTIMAIGYRDASADRAIAISNTIADELSRYYSELSGLQYDTNVNQLGSELARKSATLSSLQRRLGAISARNPYVVSDKSVDNLTTDLNSLHQQRSLAAAQLAGDVALANTSTGAGTSKTAKHEILAGDLQFQDLRATAAHDAAQLLTDKASYASDFSGLRGERAKLDSEMASLHRQTLRALSDPDAYSASAAGTRATHARQVAVIAGDTARVKELDGLIAVRQRYLDDYSVNGTRFAEARAERDVTQIEYEAIATRRANALSNRAEASFLGSIVVLDRAIKSDTELAGARLRLIVLAIALLVALAAGAALLAETLDPRLRRAEQVEALYGMPVVADVRSTS
jgi:capsular polysaccharide biosynthesis protein